MTQTIELGGLDLSTIKTAAPLGSLLDANGVYRDAGGLRPLPRPEKMTLPDGFVLCGIHTTASGQKMLILRDATATNKTTIWYVYESDAYSVSPEYLCTLSVSRSVDVDVYGLKNFLILKDADHAEDMLIFLLNSENDIYEGPMNRLPEFPVEFALVHDLRSRKYEELDCAFSVEYISGRDSAEAGNLETQAFFGGLNKYLAEARDEGCFCEPFFVRYALRMYDGSSVMASAPVLMTPISTLRYVVCRREAKALQGDKTQVTYKAMQGRSLNPCRLFYRPLFDRREIEKYKSVITHIDVYVSGPVITYNSDEDVNWGHRGTVDNIIKHCADIYLQNGYSNGIEIGECSEKILERIGDNPTTGNGPAYMRLGAPKTDKENDLTAFESVGQYYLIDSIPIEKLPTAGGEKFYPVDIREGDLNAVEQKQRLADGYQEHHDVGGQYLLTYNSRLNIGNVSLGLFGGFPIRMLSAYDSRGGGVKTRIAVRLATEEGESWVSSANSRVAGSGADVLLSQSVPFRWVYYPDTRAKQMLVMLYHDDGTPTAIFNLQLKEHPMLNGAYYFTPYGVGTHSNNTRSVTSLSVTEKTALGIGADGKVGKVMQEQAYLTLANRIYTSEVFNPLRWRVEMINAVGSGEIRGLATAARALSSGQFGQFPLYAFCSDGIWALSATEVGSWASVQPISREVLVGPHALCNLDSSVAFATERSVMLISGAEVTDIAAALDDSISGLRPQHSTDPKGIESFTSSVGFRGNLAGCRMLYDYAHTLLYVYFPDAYSDVDQTPAYVLNFATSAWTYTDDLGAELGKIVKSLNLYPDSGCLTKDTWLRFGNGREERGDEGRGFTIVTNPFMAGEALRHKKIREVGLIGDIRREGIWIDLWGSRDMAHWRRIGAQRGWTLRELCGSEYRWYILRIYGDMLPWESVTAAGVQVVGVGGRHFAR